MNTSTDKENYTTDAISNELIASLLNKFAATERQSATQIHLLKQQVQKLQATLDAGSNQPKVVVAAKKATRLDSKLIDPIGRGTLLNPAHEEQLQKQVNKMVDKFVADVHEAHVANPANMSGQTYITNVLADDCNDLMNKPLGAEQRTVVSIEASVAHDPVFARVWSKTKGAIRRKYSNAKKNKFGIRIYKGPNAPRQMLPCIPHVATINSPLTKGQVDENTKIARRIKLQAIAAASPFNKSWITKEVLRSILNRVPGHENTSFDTKVNYFRILKSITQEGGSSSGYLVGVLARINAAEKSGCRSKMLKAEFVASFQTQKTQPLTTPPKKTTINAQMLKSVDKMLDELNSSDESDDDDDTGNVSRFI